MPTCCWISKVPVFSLSSEFSILKRKRFGNATSIFIYFSTFVKYKTNQIKLALWLKGRDKLFRPFPVFITFHPWFETVACCEVHHRPLLSTVTKRVQEVKFILFQDRRKFLKYNNLIHTFNFKVKK